jgi:hypothetical protein
MKAIAIKRGFHNGRLVERGAVLEWPDPDPKKGTKLPRWLQPADKDLPPEPKNATTGDTKPADARLAVAQKARGQQASME